MDKEKADMIIYTTEDGLTKVETTFDGDTVWLSIDQMAELFQRDRSVIGKHVRNIFKEGELEKEFISSLDNDTQNETVCLLSNRKPDTTVKLIIH